MRKILLVLMLALGLAACGDRTTTYQVAAPADTVVVADTVLVPGPACAGCHGPRCRRHR